jgi:hypothetical protein
MSLLGRADTTSRWKADPHSFLADVRDGYDVRRLAMEGLS